MQKLLLSILLFTLIVSCNKDEAIKEDIQIRVKVSYMPENYTGVKPDNNAKIFIYYDLLSMEMVAYNYVSDGKLMYGDDIILPDQIFLADVKGECVITPEYLNKKVTIMVESNFYSGRLAHTSHPDIRGKIIFEAIFNP